MPVLQCDVTGSVFLVVIVEDSPVGQGEIGKKMVGGDDAPDRQVGDRHIDVRHQMQPAGPDPRPLHDDIGEVVGDSSRPLTPGTSFRLTCVFDSVAVAQILNQAPMAVADLLADLAARRVPRVPGTAVFLTRTSAGVPPVMIWHLRQNRSLHERVLVLTALTESKPWVDAAERLSVVKEGENFWRATAIYGFMERPDIPRLLEEAHEKGCSLDLDDVTYYVGHEHVVHRERGAVLPQWQEALFAAMIRNASHVTDYFRLPGERVVEIGRQISI
jgi:hypothetical protein